MQYAATFVLGAREVRTCDVCVYVYRIQCVNARANTFRAKLIRGYIYNGAMCECVRCMNLIIRAHHPRVYLVYIYISTYMYDVCVCAMYVRLNISVKD